MFKIVDVRDCVCVFYYEYNKNIFYLLKEKHQTKRLKVKKTVYNIFF